MRSFLYIAQSGPNIALDLISLVFITDIIVELNVGEVEVELNSKEGTSSAKLFGDLCKISSYFSIFSCNLVYTREVSASSDSRMIR